LRNDLALIVSAAVLVSACGARRGAPPGGPRVPEKAPRLAVTRLVAFGDGLTEGLVQVCGASAAVPPAPGSAARARTGVGGRLGPAVSYPNRLQALLSERYVGQTIEVTNEGVGGEEIQSGAASLLQTLGRDGPEALLLLEGIHNINARHAAAISEVVGGLRGMIQEARTRGIVVFVGTLLPEREGGCRAFDYGDQVNDIIAANVQIRSMVGSEGAVLVDLYRAFDGRTAILLGEDGLHPSAAGYERIAEAFFAAIAQHLEE
jgi:lysophospholipase L1-like esterase